jgi:hypothetical protein
MRAPESTLDNQVESAIHTLVDDLAAQLRTAQAEVSKLRIQLRAAQDDVFKLRNELLMRPRLPFNDED